MTLVLSEADSLFFHPHGEGQSAAFHVAYVWKRQAVFDRRADDGLSPERQFGHGRRVFDELSGGQHLRQLADDFFARGRRQLGHHQAGR